MYQTQKSKSDTLILLAVDHILPELIFGLKTVDPGYLAIVSCQQKLCYALAPSDKIPKEEDVR